MITDAKDWATLAAAAIFAAIFNFQPRVRWPAKGQHGYRRVISFCAGTAVAYVFVHLLPEVAVASDEVARDSEVLGLPFAEVGVYTAALLGFMLFYGLEHLVRRTRPGGSREEGASDAELFHLRVLIASYTLYVFVASYVMAHQMEIGRGQLARFAVAMGLHFLAVGYGLRRESHAVYDAWGRRILAAAPFVGWLFAVLFPLGDRAANMLLGFVAGSLIMNTMTSELPGEKDGRFFAFLSGGVAYTAVLLIAR